MAAGCSDIEMDLEAEYQRAIAALEEANLSSLCPFFKEQGLKDEVLLRLQSEEELKELFVQKLQPFTSLWFQRYLTDIATPRPFGYDVEKIFYEKGSKLHVNVTENREVEFKSFIAPPPHVGPQHSLLTWKMMEKAKHFICGCLNGDRKGIIYFGVGDQDREILGLEIEDMMDEITTAFQDVLNDHIISDAGRKLSAVGEQDCIKIHFVPVKSKAGNPTGLYVIEIEVWRNWTFCEDKVYYGKTWNEKSDNNSRGAHFRKLKDFFNVKPGELDDAQVRLCGRTTKVKKEEVFEKVKKPLQKKYEEWKRDQDLDSNSSLTDEQLINEARKEAVTEEMFTSINNEVATCWKSLAPHLGIDAVTCDIIDIDEKKIVDKAKKLFMEWKQREIGKATVGRLVDALKKIQKKQFAEKLLAEVLRIKATTATK